MIRTLLILLIITIFLERLSIPVGELNLKVSQVFLFISWLIILITHQSYFINKNIFILLLFLLFLLLSSLFGLFPFYSLKGFFLLFIYSSTIPFIGFVINDKKNIFEFSYTALSKATVFFALFVIVAALVYALTGNEFLGAETNFIQSFSDEIGKGEVTRAYGMFSMATSASVSLASLSFLFIGPSVYDKSTLKRNLLPIIIILLGCFATYSRGFIIGLAGGFVYLFYSFGRVSNNIGKYLKYFLLSVMFMAVSLIGIHFLFRSQEWYLAIISKFYAMFDVQTGSGLYRILVWVQLIQDFIQHPFWGNGILYYQKTFHKDANAENFVLELLSGGGLITTSLFFAFCISLIRIKKSQRNKLFSLEIKALSLKACFVSMFLGYLTNPGFWTHLPWLIMALILATKGLSSNEA